LSAVARRNPPRASAQPNALQWPAWTADAATPSNLTATPATPR
jgi:hypothetical protein